MVEASDNDATLSRLLSAIKSSDGEAHDGIRSWRQSSTAWTELFRFLRNYVANYTERQNAIAGNDDLMNLAAKRVSIDTDALTGESGNPGNGFLELRCAIQFFGNLVTNNNQNKHIVWPRISPCFLTLLSCCDATVVKYSEMLLFNCIVRAPDLRDCLLYSHSDGNSIMSLLLQTMAKQESEWSLYALECCLQSQYFMERCYPNFSAIERLLLLDILLSTISRHEKLQQFTTNEIPVDNVHWIAQEFEKRADSVLCAKQLVDVNDPSEVVRFVEVICTASSNHVYGKQLSLPSSLLCCALSFLKCIHMTSKNTSSWFTPFDRQGDLVLQPESANVAGDHPVDGLKSSLIRLVANMCWQNKRNQDLVREFDGIPLLLDCCKLDTRNPYIIQWVVFAIRNLCEGNLENQELIASMDRQHLVDASVMVDLRMASGKKDEDNPEDGAEASVRVDNRPTMERAKDDILDLFS